MKPRCPAPVRTALLALALLSSSGAAAWGEASSGKVSSSGSSSVISSVELERSIRCTGRSCVVQRQLIDQLFAAPEALADVARVVPAFKDGEVVGFKVFGIRIGSLLARLGLMNGDIVKSVNGAAFRSPEQALIVATTLKTARRLDLLVERLNKPITFDYTIR
jgi:general secretion pathway protein C